MVNYLARRTIVIFILTILLFHMPMTHVSAQDEGSGHNNYVNTVEWSNNGTILASGSTDETVKLWSENGDLISTKKSLSDGHNGSVLDLAWSPNDNRLASVSTDQTVFIWNMSHSDPRPEMYYDNSLGFVKTVSFHPNASSNVVAYGGNGGFLRVFQANNSLIDTTRSNISRVLRGQAGISDELITSETIRDLEFSPDGNTIATISEEGILQFSDNNLNGTYELQGFENVTISEDSPLFSMDVTDSFKNFVIASKSSVQLYQSEFGTLSESIIELDCSDCLNMGVEFSPSEDRVAIAAGQEVAVFEFSNSTGFGDKIFSLNVVSEFGYENDVKTVDISWNPDGERLAIASGADVISYNVVTDELDFRVEGVIPTTPPVAIIAGIILVVIIALIILIRRR